MRGILFDQPHVVDGRGASASAARSSAAASSTRCPEGADAYLLKAVLHDWEDDDALRILARCRAAIPAHGALLVVERDLGAPNEDADAKLSDLNMMVGAGGRERTRDEFADAVRRGRLRPAERDAQRHRAERRSRRIRSERRDSSPAAALSSRRPPTSAVG